MQNKIKHTNYIKIQDGCSQKCAYCAIRTFRGQSISEPYKDIYDEVKDCVENKKMQFLQLEGINTVEYYDPSIGYIADLLKQLTKDFPNTYFNLMHINPFDTPKVKAVIDVISESDKLLKTCLFSIQAGCDSILQNMHRPYTKQKLLELFDYAHTKNIEFTVEIIPGFPGETEENFSETYEFLKNISPVTFYINGFSARPGTEAYTLPNQIDVDIIIERINKYTRLKESLISKYMQSVHKKEIILINEPHKGLRTIHKIPVLNKCINPINGNIIIKTVNFDGKILYIED